MKSNIFVNTFLLCLISYAISTDKSLNKMMKHKAERDFVDKSTSNKKEKEGEAISKLKKLLGKADEEETKEPTEEELKKKTKEKQSKIALKIIDKIKNFEDYIRSQKTPYHTPLKEKVFSSK
mmetsp:Transcript_19083/g.19809  ORF Transcript_19083/g.19809 Transcript_19083/m.19809 type:complete len:122 (+) Transcript_19083:3-368(+)